MPFYDLSKQQRTNLVAKINNDILAELKSARLKKRLMKKRDLEKIECFFQEIERVGSQSEE